MAGELQPLAQNFKVVDENGFPTLYFIKWAQQRQIDISEGITLVDLQAYLTAHMLREGSGIQFTPDGDINNSPLIAADVQEILDQISATRGTVIYRGLLGWAALAPGTAGYLLSTNGAGADPSWIAPAGGGGGGLVLLEQHTAAASATLDFTAWYSSTYDEYLIEIINLVPATNVVSLRMRMSTNGGVSYDSAGNYGWTAAGDNRFGEGRGGADTGATAIQCMYAANQDNTATKGTSGYARLFSPASTALHKAVRGSLNDIITGVMQVEEFYGSYNSLTAVNAFQFFFSSGNIASGIIRVYGVQK